MRARLLGIPALALTLLGNGPAVAAEPVQPISEEQPSLELLEFLGEWQTGEGVWFDPTEKEQKDGSTQEQSYEQTPNRK